MEDNDIEVVDNDDSQETECIDLCNCEDTCPCDLYLE